MKRHWQYFIVGLLVFVLTACQSSEESQPKPTHTRIPGGATQIYMTVVAEQEAQGIATFTPGFDSLQNAINLTLTPQGTHSPVPSRTPFPGYQTQVYQGVVETQRALGQATFTPGVDSANAIETAIAGTLFPATATLTFTPRPTFTPNPPYPGFGTQVFDGVNETLAAENRNTLTPNPQNAVETSIALTLAYTWWGTNTPEATPTPSQ